MSALDRLVVALLRRDVRGAGRLAGLAYRGRPLRTTLNGLRWAANPLDWMDRQVIRDGTYELEITDRLVALLPRDGCLWDVGANAGVHGLSVKARRPDVAVIAFEPSPAEFLRLSRNASLNALDVRAFCIALSDIRGYRDLSLAAGNSGHNSLRPWQDVAYARTTPVWCDTGDDLLAAGVRRPDVVKVDVEGAELAVLEGMPGLLGEVRHVIFETPGADSPAARALVAAGFALEPLSGGNWLATGSA